MACFWSGKSDGGADLYLLQTTNLWLLTDESNGDLAAYTIQTIQCDMSITNLPGTLMGTLQGPSLLNR